ncbi:hypothetical protein AMR41_02300 [Hapalosiphon sp. MRB220]|nr:hypothetical protein AMR41_02300 [Hapalosiphon sp. MRB220]
MSNSNNTGILAVITAVGGLGGCAAIITALHQAGYLPRGPVLPTSTTAPNIQITSSTSTTQTNGNFNVKAEDKRGFKFTNPKSKTVKINFRTNGVWVGSDKPDFGYTSAEGYMDQDGDAYFDDRSLCPRLPVASLVVQLSQEKDCVYVGKEKTLTLQADQEIYFYMNDVNHNNNEGLVEVNWSMVQ